MPVIKIEVLASELTEIIVALKFRADYLEREVTESPQGWSDSARSEMQTDATRIYALAGRLDDIR